MTIAELTERIRKTNPDMTEEKLMEELKKSNIYTVGIMLIMENIKED